MTTARRSFPSARVECPGRAAWQLKNDAATSYSSVELAVQGVERLRVAYDEYRSEAPAVA